MEQAEVGALELEKLRSETPALYGAWIDGELILIGPEHPQYEEAKRSFEERMSAND